MRRRSLAAQTLLASAAAAFGIWWSSPSAELRAAPDTPRVSWSPCYREFGLPFECGTVQVPLDHDGPGGAAISIALVQARRVGPGHPNRVALPQSGRSRRFWSRLPAGHRADHAASAPGPLRSHRLRSTRHRAQHGGALLWEPAPVGPALHAVPIPRHAREEAQWAAADQYLVGACDQRAARIIDHMSTADVARDLDLLRQAVGDQLLTYVGYSYRLVPGRHVREPLPRQVSCARRRWRARPRSLVDRRTRRSGNHAVLDPSAKRRGSRGDARRVLSPLRRRWTQLRVCRQCGRALRGARGAVESGTARDPESLYWRDRTVLLCRSHRQCARRHVRLVLLAIVCGVSGVHRRECHTGSARRAAGTGP